MTNKEKVYEQLILLSKKVELDDTNQGVTAIEISEILKLQRNVISHYLNELAREGLAYKTNTRPVYFLDINIKKKKDGQEVKSSNDPFTKLIGYNGSLKEQVEQCKAAAVYPITGLPITLTGNSGVGKSFIANLIYEYAVEKGCIEKDAPFVTFNCADYANNPELLSANLFGYKKGAFTGAEKDTIGIIEEANGGYLFLDEVHRLSPEGQEKLFLFLDKGEFRRIGETGSWRKSKVRFIFATTEDLDKVLLDTFRRRIPIFVEIPSLEKRRINERVHMVHSFYLNEAKKIDKDLVISKNVINTLLSIKGNGNIGLLKNIIIASCANAYRNQLNNEVLEIDINDFPNKIKGSFQIKQNFYSENMTISKNHIIEEFPKLISTDENSIIKEEFKNITKLIQQFNTATIDNDKFKKLSTASMNKVLNDLSFNKTYIETDIVTYQLVFKIVENALSYIQQNYGIKYYGNTSKLLTYSVIMLKNISITETIRNFDFKYYEKILKKKLSKSYVIAKKMDSLIQNSLDYNCGELLIGYLTIFVNSFLLNIKTNCNAFIVAHGFSTASSIASVANTCYEEFIFEAFDMPLDVTTATVVKSIKQYLANLNTDKGTILLVDMGSLNEIYTELKNVITGDVGIINNISTQMALDVANRILNDEPVEEIVKKCAENNKTEYRYYEDPKKKSAIIVTCISGLGTAEKLREIMTKCVGDAEIEVIAHDYNSLVNDIQNNMLLKSHDVKLIITTTPLVANGIPVIELQNIINENGEEAIAEALQGVVKRKRLEDIKDDIIKFFSLQNILNQLTILNPNKIIDEVSKIISNFEYALNIKFESNLKLALTIHTSILIERLVLRDAVTSHPNEENFIKCHSDFIELSKEIFSEILKEYRVEIPIAEIVIIYEIISSRVKIK
ncbi:Transcriptional regulator containing an AAA-type ATPase domain and a DNA-binding domain [Clostridium cavendishii DSM 21758]|uniref:Transcriptional regulator containing an AAA-type ATPase domain and a DNA-binding domain n=1 Tax=Clostridium cavendishii DSM 21758 TaxID=1121302 RepID=A0A1M6URN3_9CLOT|nr:sigma-54-dependent transcriptional regulator [Clostridium cavendishii]SHK71804.1 Transcriptional regulator containing an AAA-type ATPase domain and a DNA-binding domain [Clostridium cavendishii DSM 21758]